jgi:Zn-dependent peptidase ImmA (M78 family)/DNA-binding XRE family transcriptional regulator
MNTEAPKGTRLPFNSGMLKWAREWRHRTAEEAAQRVGVAVEVITAWESPTEQAAPTVRQARLLAEFYGRHFNEFFYDEPPAIKASALVPDFRMHRGVPEPREHREILEIQHWAEAQRLNAIGLYEDLDEPIPQFPSDLQARLGDDVEVAAAGARKVLGFSIEQQKRLKAAEQTKLPTILRNKIESLGVLVLKKTELAEHRVRGLCFVQFPLPIIIYGAEAPAAQAFTVVHELAHILLRQSAISGGFSKDQSSTNERRVESWCNRFTGAFLVPEAALAELRRKPERPAPSIEDQALAELAKAFRVSPHAMLVRLVQLGYVADSYYWGVKQPLFAQQEAGFKSSGRSLYWGSRVVTTHGRLYTGLVLEAWSSGKIPYHQAADYLGIKRLSHLNDIRREFRA